MGTAEPGSFGELLRLHRMAAGLTQGELAARAGLSKRRIHDWSAVSASFGTPTQGVVWRTRWPQ
jgi:transcriptional regulator with XRE-family HTH domain